MKHYNDAKLILVTDYEDGTTEVQEEKIRNKTDAQIEAIASKLWKQRHFADKKRSRPTRYWVCDSFARIHHKIPAHVLKAEQGIINWNAEAVTAWANGEGPLGCISDWQNWIVEGKTEFVQAKSLQINGDFHEPNYIHM